MIPVVQLIKDSIKAYFGDRSIIYAAGLAYYAVFAIAPLMVFVTVVAGLFVGRSTAVEQIAAFVHYLAGPEMAELLTGLAESVGQSTFSARWTLLGVLGLVLSAAGIFTQLDTALNDIWGITTLKPQSMADRVVLLRHKTGPFIIVFFLGLLFSSSVLVGTMLDAVSTRLAQLLPQISGLLPHMNRLLIPTLAFATFTAIFKWLPDARSRWRDMAVGGLVTTVLFLIGRLLLVLYLDRSGKITPFGSVGSIVVLLIWVYYSAQIVLFGAEFTKLFADRFGQPVEPRRMVVFQDVAHLVAESTASSTSAESLSGVADEK